MAFVLSSCNNEDDIDEIFVGRNWYIVGYKVSNTEADKEDIKTLLDSGTGAYFFNFSANRFTAILSNGTSFSGSWKADGKKNTLNMTVDRVPSLPTTLDKTLYSIIEKASAYEGDANLMVIKDNHNNIIRLSR